MSNRSVASTVSFICASTALALSWKTRLVDSRRLNAASNPRSSLTRPRQAINRETSGALSRNSLSCSIPNFDLAAVLGILLLVLLCCAGPFISKVIRDAVDRHSSKYGYLVVQTADRAAKPSHNSNLVNARVDC